MKLVIFTMIIPLIILINFYMGILNGFDHSVQFLYFVMILVVSIGVYGILFLFLRDKWRDQWAYAGIIGVLLVASIGFGFLSFEELSKVEVGIINPNMGASVHAQFEVSGLFKNIPENKDIWLYTFHPVTKKYYPESMPVTKRNNMNSDVGSWNYYYMSSKNRFKGTGNNFQIGVFISNKTDREYIQKEINSAKGSISGMNQLPNRIEDLGIKMNVTYG